MAKKLEKFIPKEAVMEKLRKYAKTLENDTKTCENYKKKSALDKLAAVNTAIDIVLCTKTAVIDAAAVEYWTQTETE